ncbi:Hypothetical protein NTJ_01009 [Nesidiocoris tenuis]|uniref:Uncharacterized protein n=1 Tax=Nesidiocoris tenuis TaxID=355587 RepID=A0ABN7A880_9HEMI|nr:Hypothetical protein NTJ_01009 [Nesidiocoris tenuis]
MKFFKHPDRVRSLINRPSFAFRAFCPSAVTSCRLLETFDDSDLNRILNLSVEIREKRGEKSPGVIEKLSDLEPDGVPLTGFQFALYADDSTGEQIWFFEGRADSWASCAGKTS